MTVRDVLTALQTRPRDAELLANQFPMPKAVRLIGVSLSSLCRDGAHVDPQMALAL